MRFALFIAALLCCAGAADAQTNQRAAPNTARLYTRAPTPITDRASFPRQIERGDTIVEFQMEAVPRRVFSDAAGSEQPLERMLLGDNREVFCGNAALTEAEAGTTPPDVKLPRRCFRDSDNDGAADQVFAVLGETPSGLGLDHGASMAAPRAWAETPPADRRLIYRYGGAATGRVREDGRLGEGGVEVYPVNVIDGRALPSREPMLIGCLGDGRCTPLPGSVDPIVALANPTVEGGVEARILTVPEAIAVSDEVSAMIDRLRTARTERGTVRPAGEPAPEAVPAQ